MLERQSTCLLVSNRQRKGTSLLFWHAFLQRSSRIQGLGDSVLQAFPTGVSYSYEHSHEGELLYAQDRGHQDWPVITFLFNSH